MPISQLMEARNKQKKVAPPRATTIIDTVEGYILKILMAIILWRVTMVFQYALSQTNLVFYLGQSGVKLFYKATIA